LRLASREFDEMPKRVVPIAKGYIDKV
jgi:hypothetical protein